MKKFGKKKELVDKICEICAIEKGSEAARIIENTRKSDLKKMIEYETEVMRKKEDDYFVCTFCEECTNCEEQGMF